MKQLSLVALYGEKSEVFSDLLCRCIEIIQKSPLQGHFCPYALEQIHGTIVGMERVPGNEGFINANLLASTGNNVRMEFSRLKSTLCKHLPITVRFGGFGTTDTGFRSSGLWPWERSFLVQWPTHRCTLIGWPHCCGDFTTNRLLNALRDDLTVDCGLGHKYVGDNDLFLVLGHLSPLDSLTPSEAARLSDAASSVEARIRTMLADNPVEVLIDRQDISIVAYEDTRLAPESTTALPITDRRCKPDGILSLYG